MKYIIIAYKSESTEYRCSCAVGEFPSDVQVIECSSEEEKDKKVLEFQNLVRDRDENPYEIMVIEGGNIIRDFSG